MNSKYISAIIAVVIIAVGAFLFNTSDDSPRRSRRSNNTNSTEAVAGTQTSSSGNSIGVNPTVNVYIENSGSMDGYVKGVTEFEQAVYSYLSDIEISDFADSLNLFYINSKIIAQGSDISDFIEKLEPSNFRVRGGNRGVSDISEVFKNVLSETQQNDVSILITDGTFSPGRGKNANEYLTNQQIGIKNTMAEHLKAYPTTAVVMYQLSSQFDGYYYNREDAKTKLKAQRPFYIWIIGDREQLDKLTSVVPTSKMKGSGVLYTFSITQGNRKVDYAVKRGSGEFDLDRKSRNNTIKNLEKDTRERNSDARFSVNVNLSGFLLDDSYLSNRQNYNSSDNYELSISKANSNKFGYTHQLNYSSQRVKKGVVTTSLLSKVPNWVEQSNDDEGSEPIEGKTYGIKHQLLGVYDAFTFKDDFYTEIKININ